MHVKFYPNKKGDRLVLARWGGGGAALFEGFLPPFKVRYAKVYSVSRGGGQNIWTHSFPIFWAPLPVINDRSLINLSAPISRFLEGCGMGCFLGEVDLGQELLAV